MTEQTEQLSEAQKAAAFEWLRYLPERAFLQLTPRDLEQAERALRAWNQAEKERDQFRASATGIHFTKGGKLAVLFDFGAHLERQRMWSERTFGPGARTQGVIDHIRKELREIAENPDDLEEWIDVVILALDGAWRTGATPDAIIEALIAKQTKNEQREWPDWRTMPADQAIEHERGGEAVDQLEPESDLEWLEGIASSDADEGTREAIINTVARIRQKAKEAEREIGMFERANHEWAKKAECQRKRIRTLTAALRFYACHEHWMAPTGDAKGRNLLVACGESGKPDGWAEAEQALVTGALVEETEQTERETTGADIIDWADGIRGALGTEHASKVTAQEARIADAIVKAMPDPSEASRGQNSEIASQEMMAIGSTLRFVDLVVKPHRCDSDGVSGCWRCQTVYLASVVRRMLPELNHAN